MLPGSRSLSKELGINRKTVQAVYEELEAQGWLVTLLEKAHLWQMFYRKKASNRAKS